MICNLTKRSIVSRNTVAARTLWQRARGMIGRRFNGFDAMLFDHCDSIHSCFMSIPLDIIFAGRDCRILKTVENFKPWTLFCCCKKAFYVIELPTGTITRTSCACGDMLDLTAVPDAETERLFAPGRDLIPGKSGGAVPCEKED